MPGASVEDGVEATQPPGRAFVDDSSGTGAAGHPLFRRARVRRYLAGHHRPLSPDPHRQVIMRNQLAATPIAALSLALALGAGAQSAHAQETQVPVDTAGRVVEIDRALALQLGLYLDEYPDLQVARLFRADDGSYVLELTLRRDGRILRQRVPMAEDEVAALRQRVSALPAAAPTPVDDGDQGARTLLVAGAALVGTGFYGWAVPVVLDLQNEGAAAGYMFTAAGSILIPYLYTSDRAVTYGMTNAWWWGATRGIAHGMELVGLVDEDPGGDALVFGGLAASLAEGVAGYAWAERSGMSAGTAHTIGNFGDLGQFWAGSAMLIVQPDPGRIVLGGLLAGSAAGLVAGERVAARRAFTWGDAEVMRAAALVGAADGVAVWDVLTDDDSDDDIRILGGLLLAGSAAGALWADRTLRGRDHSVGQAVIVDLAVASGYAVGAGFAFILGGSDGDSELFTSLGAVGATTGLALAVGSMAESATRRDRRRWDDGRLDLQLNPYGLARLAAPDLDPVASADQAPPVPLIVLRYTF